MARKPPAPGSFDPGDIPMSAGPAPQPAQQQRPQPQERTYTEQEVTEHSEFVRMQTRKETVLQMLHGKALSENQVYLANTLAFIMVDYKFLPPEILKPEYPDQEQPE